MRDVGISTGKIVSLSAISGAIGPIAGLSAALILPAGLAVSNGKNSVSVLTPEQKEKLLDTLIPKID